MNFKQAEILICINKYQNITKAAEYLGIKQPTVTFHMKNLEKEMNIILFKHNIGKILLTDAGKALLHYAEKIVMLTKDAENLMKTFSLNEMRTFKLGGSMIPSKYILPKFLNGFKNKYPKLNISLTTLSAPVICEMVSKFELDLGIVSITEENKFDNLEFHYIDKDEMVLVYSPKSKLAQYKCEINSKIISQQHFILHDKNSTTGMLTDKWAKENNITLNPYLEVASTEIIKSMVVNNVGISVLPFICIEEEVKTQKLLYTKLFNNSVKRNIYLVYNKERVMLPVVKEFIDYFKESLVLSKNDGNYNSN